MANPPFEHVFAIGKGEFPLPCLLLGIPVVEVDDIALQSRWGGRRARPQDV